MSDQTWSIYLEKIFRYSRAFERYTIHSDWIRNKKVIVNQKLANIKLTYTQLEVLINEKNFFKIFTFDGDANIVVLNSPFNTNIIPKDILLAIWDNCLLFSIFSQAAQFIYRYLCLNRFLQPTHYTIHHN